MTKPSQDKRNMILAINGREDWLLMRKLDGEEAIGEPFLYTLSLLSSDTQVDAKQVLGRPAQIRCSLTYGAKRQINGIISQFCRLDDGLTDEGLYLHRYQAELRPQLWLLTLSSHCRFFHRKSVLEIATSLLDERQVLWEKRIQNEQDYPRLEHCAQYNETDFNFLSRLLEREGIHYFFEHKNGQDYVVLADHPGAHRPLSEQVPQAKLRYQSQAWLVDTPGATMHTVFPWTTSQGLAPNICELNGYDFEKPVDSLHRGLVTRASATDDGLPGFKQQHDHDGYQDTGVGRHYARTRLEAWQAQQQSVSARCHALGIVPGGCVQLIDHPIAGYNREYLATRAQYHLENDVYASTSEKIEAPWCHFQAMPSDRAFRMPLATPRPMAVGPQTAVVVSEKLDNGEIHVDRFGRVQVQFNWEQFAPPQDGAERTHRCWVRVSQHWAGKGWGAMFLPRVGHEVIVDFIDGDIDRPLIVGRVYNGANNVPYELPKHSAVSTLMSRSTGEGSTGFNELRFNDAQGKEQVYLHAEKDWKNYVKHDMLTWVGRDQHHEIAGEQRLRVRKDQHISIDGTLQQKIAGKVALQGAQAVELKAGSKLVAQGTQLYLTGTASLVIQAPLISLKAGGSFITLDASGVCVSGPLVRINSGGSARAGQESTPASPKAPLNSTQDEGKTPE
ncbi:type VI secretion system Vgr family protein [Paludibacterium purpuratum]|uniref:Type VI secretion system secreted protein VgrG n=1 Tax=Paludibacterium purpuratum TaxID=1144873 RepID=A0A4R7B3K5_9NEIS|nr:type VI secretion system tip protein TssI/VgrG [Paludibacterium purpuratum]TDR78366.1 type VI secretion system secreted protein VgrG [Paludibacterium purpuratum]